MATKKAPPKKALKVATKKVAKKPTTKPYTGKKRGRPVKVKPQINQDNVVSSTDVIQTKPSQENIDVLRRIDVIDVRELGIVDRFAILTMLVGENYLTDTGAHLMDNPATLVMGLEASFLRLNNMNRLVSAISEDYPEIDGLTVCSVSAQVNASIFFSQPELYNPMPF